MRRFCKADVKLSWGHAVRQSRQPASQTWNYEMHHGKNGSITSKRLPDGNSKQADWDQFGREILRKFQPNDNCLGVICEKKTWPNEYYHN